MRLFFQSLIHCFLSTYYVPGTRLGTGDTTALTKPPALMEDVVWSSKQLRTCTLSQMAHHLSTARLWASCLTSLSLICKRNNYSTHLIGLF